MSQKMNIVEAVNQALKDEMEDDEDVIILGEDVGEDGGVFRATEGIQNEFGEERCLSSPLAESGIVGTSIGMALYGMRPVPEIQFSGFSYLAFHQIKEHAARFRMRTRGGKDVPMTVRAPYGGGINALEHHCESPEAFFAHSQGLHVVIPSTPQDTYSLLRKSIRLDDPVVFLEPKKTYRAFKEEVDTEKDVELESSKIVQEGDDITVESVQKTGRCMVVHEAPKTGGFGAEVAARIQEEAILHLEAPVKRVGSYDIPYPLYDLEDYYIPDENRVKHGIKEALEF